MIFHSNYSKKHIKVLEVGDVFYNGTSTLFWDRERIHNAGTDAVFSIVNKVTFMKLNQIQKAHFFKAHSPQERLMFYSDTTAKKSYKALSNQGSTLNQSTRPKLQNYVSSVSEIAFSSSIKSRKYIIPNHKASKKG